MPDRTRLDRGAAALLLAAFVAFCCVFSAHDNDTGWHLKTGELIVSTRSIPTADPFSYTIAGKPWTAFEWLSDVAMHCADAAGGVYGVIGLKTAVALAAFLLAFYCADASAPLAALCLGLACAVSQAELLERPLIVDLLFIAWLNAALARPFRMKWRWQIPLLIALWANLHGGAAVLGVVILLCESFGRDPRERKARRSLAALGAIALAATPQGLGLFVHLRSTLSLKELGWIAEWRPLRNPFTLEAAVLAVGLWAAVKDWKRRPGRAAWLLILGAASLGARRWLPLFALPAMASAAENAPKKIAVRVPALAAALALLGFYWWNHIYRPWGRAFGYSSYEDLAGAVKFLDENKIEGRMYNPFDAGGALIALAWPRRKVFIDSRALEYGDARLREAVLWRNDWPALARKYGFDYAVFFNRRDGYPCRTLDDSKDWRPAYFDDAALVYLPGKKGYRFLRPNSPDFDWVEPILEERGLDEESSRAVDSCGRCSEALLLRSYILARRGRADEAKALEREAAAHVFWKPELWSDLGRVQKALGREDASRRSFAKAAAARAAL